MARVIRFGSFEVDLEADQLTENGVRVKLQNLPYRLLVALLERPGEVVTYEVLRSRLWGDTIVDFDEGMHTAVRKLRTALGDSTTSPRFIVTVPRKGYFFRAPISVAQPPVCVAPEPEFRPAANSEWMKRPGRGVGYALILGMGILVVALSAALVGKRADNGRHAGIHPFDRRPITAYPGVQRSPTLSPDGNRFAFSWVGDSGKNLDIYVQRIDGTGRVRLTDHRDPDQYPAWSPDGAKIAFIRNGELLLIPATGGPERRIAAARSIVSWSPDSSMIAFSDQAGPERGAAIFLVSVNSGERRQLTWPPIAGQDDMSPAFSPDGLSVAFMRFAAPPAVDIYRVLTSGGEPVRVAITGRPSRGLVWSPDGKYLLFSTGRHAPGLLKVPADARDSTDLRRVDIAGFNVFEPSIRARNGGGEIDLAYGHESTDWDIFGAAVGGADANPTPLVTSGRADQAPVFSPDRQRLVFCSSRSGYEEIWVSQADGSEPRRLTDFSAAAASSPRWSPDGRWIVFGATVDGNPDVYIVDSEGGPPQRMTHQSSSEGQPSWSRDGRWIYFMSNRSGTREIWKMPAKGGTASQVTRHGGVQAIESPDGQFIYYAKRHRQRGLWRIPVNGGREELVSDMVWHNLWSIADDGVYYLDVNDQVPQVFSVPCLIPVRKIDFTTSSATTIGTIQASLPTAVPIFDVTRDGKYIAWTGWRSRQSEIMLIRNLDLSSGE